MKDSRRVAIYEFSAGLRLTHWVRAVAIAVLTLSGFYIAGGFFTPAPNPEPTNYLNAIWRAIHQGVGVVLIGCFIFKCYLFLVDKHSKKELASIPDVFSPKSWIDQIKFYLFIGKHPHLKGVYNPLQFAAYFMFYIVLFVICLTGLILYVHVYHEGLGGLLYEPMRVLEVWFGGLANVRLIHHISMWIILIFVCAHVYMAIFNSVKLKNGCIDAIFSGYKFDTQEHA